MNLEPIFEGEQNSIAKRPLILLVEDNKDSLELLIHFLEAFDCLCITATNGRAALTVAQDMQPDLILLDIMLPDMDGLEVIRCLKQISRTMTIPIVAVTALARATDREQILLAGCDDYISKPYMLEDLAALVYRYLNLGSSLP